MTLAATASPGRSAAVPAKITADTSELGQLARSRRKATVLASLDSRSATLTTVPAATPLQIDGCRG